MDRKQKEKDQAFNLYFQTELSNKQICELINIDRKTLYMWVKEGDWRHTKYAAKHAPGMLVNQYYDQLGHMNNFIAQRAERPYPTKEEADVMRKVSLTLKSIKGKGITTGETVFILTDLMCNIKLRDKKIAETLANEVDNYVKSVVKEGKGLDGPWKEYLRGINEDQEYEEWASTRSQPIMPDTTHNTDDQKEEDIITPSTDLADNNTETQIDTDVNTSPAIASLNSNSDETDVAKPVLSLQEPTLSLQKAEECDQSPENETPENEGYVTPPAPSAGAGERSSSYYATLPPSQRPSPFREGNIVWINHIDDINDDEVKMGDRIQHYPDMGTFGKNRAA